MVGKRNGTIIALEIACLIICLVSGGLCFRRILDYRESAEEYEQIRTEVFCEELEQEDISPVDGEALSAMNPDYVFWIEIPGTDISYPVVQTSNNSDYLRTSFTGERCVGGCIFEDHACPSDLSGLNTVIYGHRMPDGTMFTGLKGFRDPEFSSEHAEMRIYIEKEIRTYQFFSVRQTYTHDDYSRISFSSESEFKAWLKDQYDRSMYAHEYDLADETKAVTLVTCAGDGTERLAVTWILEDIQ